jgi:hypothetical protein
VRGLDESRISVAPERAPHHHRRRRRRRRRRPSRSRRADAISGEREAWIAMPSTAGWIGGKSFRYGQPVQGQHQQQQSASRTLASAGVLLVMLL